MNWQNISIILVAAILGFLIYRGRGGIKAMFKESEAAPKYWGTFGIIILAIIAFVYLLIKL